MAIISCLKMADNEEVKESAGRGIDWEVVSLTASTYAAAPGPTEVELKENILNPDKAETSSALFMSRHFSLHPARPFEVEDIAALEKHKEKGDDVTVPDASPGRASGKDEKDWALKGISVPDEFPGLHFLDEKGLALSMHGPVYGEGKNNLQGVKNLTGKEESLYSTAAFSSFHSDAAPVVPSSYVDNEEVPEVIETSESTEDSPVDVSPQPKQIDREELGEFDLPCGAWWKRRAASFYAQAKEANAFWSVFVAAAVMGIVILGQRWQQEKRQALQLRWHLSLNNE